LARAATVRGWIKPELDGENRLFIREGRHPVVEAYLPRGEFIPNDLILGPDPGGKKKILFALITGPNMAGKSTYLRQGALIVIMAQIGSFVPAAEAKIGLTDRIFCRVGASDNLARGESTFLVEMNETARILHTATGKSLVIMDEVGRGTGTSDGLAIAWAICEYLLDRIHCRTLFATHYHELSRLTHPNLANRSMEVLEENGEVTFLRKLREGAAAESYGIHVAGLAGLPGEVLERAGFMLRRIRENSTGPSEPDIRGPPRKKESAFEDLQKTIIMSIKNLEINRLTPLEALNFLHKLKKDLTFVSEQKHNDPAPGRGDLRAGRRIKEEPDLFNSE
jgi:DNA mismatch repair protein MutS